MTDLDALYTALRKSWRQDTAVRPMKWLPHIPSTGQCAVTALVVQDYMGGDLLRVINLGDSHYFNRLPDGHEVDFTRGQFWEWAPEDEPIVRDRDYVLENESTRRRYDTLATRVRDYL